MSGHTKEPWRANRHASMSIESAEGRGVCSTGGYADNFSNGAYHDENEANARRIVDCVNALAGIENPAAFVEAARGMMDAAQRAADGCVDVSGTALVLSDYTTEARQIVADFRQSLSAFRAQIGDA